MMEVDLNHIKTIIDRIFYHIIEVRGVRKVEITSDYYWDMPPESLYDVSKRPENIDVGSLKDDWELISNLLNGNNVPIAYQLTELAPLLRCIGEILSKDLAERGG